MTIFDGARDRDMAPPLYPERLACGGSITPARKHVLWRDPEEVRANALTVIAMVVVGIVGGFLIAGMLMNESVLAFLGIQ